MPLSWDERLSVDHALIDEQHKELIDTFNRFVAACKANHGKETLAGTLNFLEGYVHKHFAAEKELMEQSEYPDINFHLAKHDEFFEKFNEMKAEFEKDGVSFSMVVELNDFLLRWFIGHIKGVDTILAGFLASRK